MEKLGVLFEGEMIECEVNRRLREELMRMGVQESASDRPAGSEARWGGDRREAT